MQKHVFKIKKNGEQEEGGGRDDKEKERMELLDNAEEILTN